MSLHDQILAVIVSWATTTAQVESVYAYGSFARQEHTPSSDLDLAILTNPKLGPVDLDGLRSRMPYPIAWHHDEPGKSVTYLGETMLKLDLVLADNAEDLAARTRHGGVQAAILRPVYQKSGVHEQILDQRLCLPGKADFTQFSDEGMKFVAYFETASRYHRRSDGFLFYFHYNLALSCLARMFSLLEAGGEARYLYAPRNILSNLGGSRLSEAKSWHELKGVLYLPEAHAAKERLASKFIQLLERASSQGVALPAKLELAPDFIRRVIARDFFFNLRDFSFAYEESVKPGVLFRGPTITRWKGTGELRRWLHESNIRHVIDFRENIEIQKDGGRLSYDPDLLTGLHYTHIPIGDAAVKAEGKSSYVSAFLGNLPSFVRAYKTLATCDGTCLVHCHVGKDRTGIFCAILALLLGLPRRTIVHDYILSEQGVKAATIAAFLDEIELLGGAQSILRVAGLDDSEVGLLKLKLLA